MLLKIRLQQTYRDRVVEGCDPPVDAEYAHDELMHFAKNLATLSGMKKIVTQQILSSSRTCDSSLEGDSTRLQLQLQEMDEAIDQAIAEHDIK